MAAISGFAEYASVKKDRGQDEATLMPAEHATDHQLASGALAIPQD